MAAQAGSLQGLHAAPAARFEQARRARPVKVPEGDTRVGEADASRAGRAAGERRSRSARPRGVRAAREACTREAAGNLRAANGALMRSHESGVGVVRSASRSNLVVIYIDLFLYRNLFNIYLNNLKLYKKYIYNIIYILIYYYYIYIRFLI